MARAPNTGLDYYPQDTDIHSDRKIRRLRNEFGAAGYMIYDYIKCLCYKENGYWVKYDGEFDFDVADFLKSGITERLVSEVVNGCVRMSLFDRSVFNVFNVITSSGIQKRYIKIKPKGRIMEELDVRSEEIDQKDELIPPKDDFGTQRKGKEIKEKQTAFAESLKPFLEKYGSAMLNDFYRRWAEPNPAMTKLRYQMQETWELPLRLATWAKNEQKWKK